MKESDEQFEKIKKNKKRSGDADSRVSDCGVNNDEGHKQGTVIKQGLGDKNEDVVVCEEKQVVLIKKSVPRRRVSTVMTPTLPTVPEETSAELAAESAEDAQAKYAKQIMEFFGTSILPPPEELDDWSYPDEKVAKEKQKNEEEKRKQAEIEEDKQSQTKPASITTINSLGITSSLLSGVKVKVDEQGRTTYIMTPETRQKMMESPEYKAHLKRREMEAEQAIMKQQSEETKMKKITPLNLDYEEDEKSPMYAENLAKFERRTRNNSAGGNHLSSAGVIEMPVIPVKHKANANSVEGGTDVGITFSSAKVPGPVDDTQVVDSKVRLSKRIATKNGKPVIDFNQFKRARRS